MNLTKEAIITALQLEPLTMEGGYFKRTYESDIFLNETKRIASAIYYLLGEGDESKWHKVACDEIWFFHGGRPAIQSLIYTDGRKEEVILGMNVEKGEKPQHLVSAGTWQHTQMLPPIDAANKSCAFSLFSTVVLPEFHYSDYTDKD